MIASEESLEISQPLTQKGKGRDLRDAVEEATGKERTVQRRKL